MTRSTAEDTDRLAFVLALAYLTVAVVLATASWASVLAPLYVLPLAVVTAFLAGRNYKNATSGSPEVGASEVKKI